MEQASDPAVPGEIRFRAGGPRGARRDKRRANDITVIAGRSVSKLTEVPAELCLYGDAEYDPGPSAGSCPAINRASGIEDVR
jgi:hypothetical protein